MLSALEDTKQEGNMVFNSKQHTTFFREKQRLAKMLYHQMIKYVLRLRGDQI